MFLLRGRRRRHQASVLAAVVAIVLSSLVHAVPAEAMTAAADWHQGFDRCGSSSTATMSTWWRNSQYYAVGIYIGGETAGAAHCAIPSASWVSTVNAQGWDIAFIWDGLQAPCSSNTYRMSSTPSTAYSQGRTAGSAAHTKAHALGASGRAVIYLDMEYYSISNTSCNTAVVNYLKGWHDYLYAVNDIDGVYSNPTAALQALLNAQCSKWTGGCIRMIWNAHWDGRGTVWGDSHIADNQWHDYRRIHQLRGGHSHAMGGVTLSVDDDCLLGWIEAGIAAFTPSSSVDAQSNYPSCPSSSTTHN